MNTTPPNFRQRYELLSGTLGGAIKVPFLYDIAAHVRFLIVLPILVVAELIVH